jgi:hypothetical protein
MTHREHLVDRHILEYQARLKHLDELMAEAADVSTTARAELASLRRDQQQLAAELHALGRQSAIDWSEKGGPMVMWDVMAERLEQLVERMEQWRALHAEKRH